MCFTSMIDIRMVATLMLDICAKMPMVTFVQTTDCSHIFGRNVLLTKVCDYFYFCYIGYFKIRRKHDDCHRAINFTFYDIMVTTWKLCFETWEQVIVLFFNHRSTSGLYQILSNGCHAKIMIWFIMFE